MIEEKTALIILAAGCSFRMGRCKFLMETTEGELFIEKELKSALLFPFRKVIVVTSVEYGNRLSEIAEKINPGRIEVEVNQFPGFERFYSLQRGLKRVEDYDYCFVHNADNPHINSVTLRQLLKHKNKSSVVVPAYKGRGGHPVLVNQSVIRSLLAADVSSRLDMELKKFQTLRLAVNDPDVLLDIDTMEDYKKYLSAY